MWRAWLVSIALLLEIVTDGVFAANARVQARVPEAKGSSSRRMMLSDDIIGRGRGITNEAVFRAMRMVPRDEFVPEPHKGDANRDCALPIGFGQTISQPFVVAFMTEKLEPRPGQRVLEVGTGSGYQAAVLSLLVGQVYTIEIIPELASRAAGDLNRLGYTNVFVRSGDGYRGWPEAAPFDSIIVTCAPEAIPKPLVDQLKEGGKMVIPVGPLTDQQLMVLHKSEGKLEQKTVLPVRFVPMTGQAQK